MISGLAFGGVTARRRNAGCEEMGQITRCAGRLLDSSDLTSFLENAQALEPVLEYAVERRQADERDVDAGGVVLRGADDHQATAGQYGRGGVVGVRVDARADVV